MNGIKQTSAPSRHPSSRGISRPCAPKLRPLWARWWPLLLVGALTLAVLAMGWHEHITLGNVVTFRDRFHLILDEHHVSSLLAYVLAYVGMTALSLPGGLVLTVAGGFMSAGCWEAPLPLLVPAPAPPGVECARHWARASMPARRRGWPSWGPASIKTPSTLFLSAAPSPPSRWLSTLRRPF